MCERGGELVAADEPAAIAKPLFDAIVMQNGQSDGCLANSAGTNERDWSEVLHQTNDLLDQLVAPIEDPGWWGWGFTRYASRRCQILDPLVVGIANLAWV